MDNETRAKLDAELRQLESLDKELETYSNTKDVDEVRLTPSLQSGFDPSKLAHRGERIDMDANRLQASEMTGNNIANRLAEFKVEDIQPIIGEREIDRILGMGPLNLTKHSQLKMMWGCQRCFMRGTSDCPHGIKDGEKHSNGYCDFAIKYHLINSKLMGTVSGMKYLRNNNIQIIKELADHYKLKLNTLRKSDKITNEESYLLKALIKLTKELGDRMDNVIKQEEGIKVEHSNKELTPEDIDRIFSQQSKTVEGRVVEDKKDDM